MQRYTDRYINKFDILNHAIVGFEFEFYCSRSYYKLLELLNRELSPIKVSGFRVYHSPFKPTVDHWKIEPDLSMGWDGIELITGPLKYTDAKLYLLKVLKILQGPEFSTDDKCSLHINISFNKETSPKLLINLNKLKMILEVDEDLIYKYFPKRENNFYARSVKRIIPYKTYDFVGNAIDILVNSLELPDTKYYGINFSHIFNDRLEFRYIGSENYEDKVHEILHLLDYFIELTWNCINEPLNEDDIIKLEEYLSKNINHFKKFRKVENFFAEYPSINLQIDKNSDFVIVKSYYDRIYEDLYDILTNIYNLSDCIINYDTLNNKIEIVGANIDTIFDIKGVDIIDSTVNNGSFHNCTFLSCEIKNTHITNCRIIESDVYKSKIESSKIIKGSMIYDCYVDNCYLDGVMKGGVFRSGKLGDNAEIDKDVKIITSANNYFGITQSGDRDDDRKLISTDKISKNKEKWIEQ